MPAKGRWFKWPLGIATIALIWSSYAHCSIHSLFISFILQQCTKHFTVLNAPSQSAAFCFWQVMCLQQQLEAMLTGDSFGSYKSKTLCWKCLKCSMCWRKNRHITHITSAHLLHCGNKTFPVFCLDSYAARFSRALQMHIYLLIICWLVLQKWLFLFFSVLGGIHTDWRQRPILWTNPAGPQVSEWPRDTCGRPQHTGSRSGSQTTQTQR